MATKPVLDLLNTVLQHKQTLKAAAASAVAIQASGVADTAGTPAAHLMAAALHGRAARAHEKCGGEH